MQVGIVLPSFSSTVQAARDAAQVAETVGIHGVFCYDHLWPIGAPGRPAIAPFPLLGALSAETSSLRLGTLVARVGMLSNELVISELLTLDALAKAGVIAGLGTSDHKSTGEYVAYGLGFAPSARRREALRSVAAGLVASGIETWIGGGSAATNAVAREVGAVLNLWSVPLDRLAQEAARGPVCWAGSLPRSPRRARELVLGLEELGATWAVFSWSGSIEPLIAAINGSMG